SLSHRRPSPIYTHGHLAPHHRPRPHRHLSLTPPPTTATHTLSLHDALPISGRQSRRHAEDQAPSLGRLRHRRLPLRHQQGRPGRSEEHTSELQSRFDLVCRLLLEKKKRSSVRRCSIHRLLSVYSGPWWRRPT